MRLMLDEGVREGDEALAARAAAGEAAAFQELYRRFDAPVRSLARRMTGDPQQAADLTQDAFQRALASIHTFDPAQRFSSWLFKIATRRIIDHLKERRRWRGADAAEEPVDPGPRPEEAVSLREDAERIRTALGRVPEEQRMVLLLFFQEHLTYAEIAAMLDISANPTSAAVSKRRASTGSGGQNDPLVGTTF